MLLLVIIIVMIIIHDLVKPKSIIHPIRAGLQKFDHIFLYIDKLLLKQERKRFGMNFFVYNSVIFSSLHFQWKHLCCF